MERAQILDALDELVSLDRSQRSELEVLAQSTTAAEHRLEDAFIRGDTAAIGAAAQRGSFTDEEHAVARFGLGGLRALIAGMESRGEAPPTEVVAALREYEAWAVPRMDQFEAECLASFRAQLESGERPF